MEACRRRAGAGYSDLDHGVLRFVEPIVGAMTGEQLGMVALFHDLTVVDEADFIRVLDGGKPVRDDEARASLEQMVQTGLLQR